VLLRPALFGLALAAVALQLGGCAGAPVAQASPESAYGIHIEALRLSAAGAMLDFRYRVIDPVKAVPVLDGRVQPYLFDSLRGAKLAVPDTPVLGRMRQTSRNHKISTKHTYFIIFANPGKAVKSGDRVTLLLGQIKVADVTVQ
jgi:hypothetical protein